MKIEQTAGLPVLTVKLDRAGARRATASASATCRTSSRSRSAGKPAGKLFEGDRRFDIVVRLPEHLRARPRRDRGAADPAAAERRREADRRCATTALTGASACRARATFRCRRSRRSTSTPGPNQISRENGKRRVVVTANVRGRDLGSFVAEAQRRVAEKVKLPRRLLDRLGRPVREAGLRAPSGCRSWCRWRCCWSSCCCSWACGSAADAAAGLHRRAAGADRRRRRRCCCAACRSRSRPASASSRCRAWRCSTAWCIVTFIERAAQRGAPPLDDAVVDGALTRLRPVLMTALVASPRLRADGARAPAPAPRCSGRWRRW